MNDVVPTIYEILGITPPRTVNGVEQDPIDGVSFAYSLTDSGAKGRLLTQYFEVMGSRAIYQRRLDGLRLRAAGSVGSGSTAWHSRVDAGQRRMGAIQPGGGLEPGQRPRI